MISFLLAAATAAVTQASDIGTPAAGGAGQPIRVAAAPSGSFGRRDAPGEADAEAARQAGVSGHFREVTDAIQGQRATRRFQQRLRAIGIPASIEACHWIGLVSEGTARGNRSHGGACSVRIRSLPARDFLICEADLGGISLIEPTFYAFDAEFIEQFVRRACF